VDHAVSAEDPTSMGAGKKKAATTKTPEVLSRQALLKRLRKKPAYQNTPAPPIAWINYYVSTLSELFSGSKASSGGAAAPSAAEPVDFSGGGALAPTAPSAAGPVDLAAGGVAAPATVPVDSPDAEAGAGAAAAAAKVGAKFKELQGKCEAYINKFRVDEKIPISETEMSKLVYGYVVQITKQLDDLGDTSNLKRILYGEAVLQGLFKKSFRPPRNERAKNIFFTVVLPLFMTAVQEQSKGDTVRKLEYNYAQYAHNFKEGDFTPKFDTLLQSVVKQIQPSNP